MKPYPFIDIKHRPVLESIVRVHSVVTDDLLAKLYEVCLKVLRSERIDGNDGAFFRSRLVTTDGTGSLVVAAVTDSKTGIYLQLAEAADGPKDLVLTVGAKWVVEQRDVQSGGIRFLNWDLGVQSPQ